MSLTQSFLRAVVIGVLTCGSIFAGDAMIVAPPAATPHRQLAAEEIRQSLVDVPQLGRTSAGVWPDSAPADCPFPKSALFGGVEFTGRRQFYTFADTWYPSWASDGNQYSPFTDGGVDKVGSHSGPPDWTTGNARIEGDDPLNLKVVPLGVHKAFSSPYAGRYPCGSLVYNGLWYYGTYCLDWSKYGWDILGPFVGFRISRDLGQTWQDTPCTPVKPLFSETIKAFDPKAYQPPRVQDWEPTPQSEPVPAARHLFPADGDWRFTENVSPEAVAQVDAIRDQALALGWTEATLYQNRGRSCFPTGDDYGLVCFLHGGCVIGEVTVRSIEVISSHGSRLRHYNRDVQQPWIRRDQPERTSAVSDISPRLPVCNRQEST